MYYYCYHGGQGGLTHITEIAVLIVFYLKLVISFFLIKFAWDYCAAVVHARLFIGVNFLYHFVHLGLHIPLIFKFFYSFSLNSLRKKFFLSFSAYIMPCGSTKSNRSRDVSVST